jgi:hypothetical protein
LLALLLTACQHPCDEYATAYCKMYADCIGLGDRTVDFCARDFRKQLNKGFNGSATEAGCGTDFLEKQTCAEFRANFATLCTGGKFLRDFCWSP